MEIIFKKHHNKYLPGQKVEVDPDLGRYLIRVGAADASDAGKDGEKKKGKQKKGKVETKELKQPVFTKTEERTEPENETTDGDTGRLPANADADRGQELAEGAAQ
jgi:hypothetical protein